MSLFSVTTVHSKLEICCKRHVERVSRDLEHNAEETPHSTDGFARWLCNLLAGLERVVITGKRSTLLEKWETQCQRECVCVWKHFHSSPKEYPSQGWKNLEPTLSIFGLLIGHKLLNNSTKLFAILTFTNQKTKGFLCMRSEKKTASDTLIWWIQIYTQNCELDANVSSSSHNYLHNLCCLYISWLFSL